MKYLLILTLFAPIIYFACRQKKWYLYLLMAFVSILPEQLSISLHDKLPLISATRILIVIAAAFWLFQRIKERNFKPPVSILVFLGINLALSVYHLLFDTDEINRIFLLIAERALIVVLLVDLIATREEFDRCVDFLILGCCALAIIGIVQTVFRYDIASVLHWRETFTSAMVAERMGLLRAYATKNAISYGCYAAFMILPIYYRLQSTGKQRYSIAFALNFVALIATFTRSAWLCVIGIAALVFVTRPLKLMRSLWPSLILIIVMCFGFGLIQPKFGDALIRTAQSSWNTVINALPDEWFQSPGSTLPGSTDSTDPTEETIPDEPEKPTFDLPEEFGANSNDPTYSRLFQWSAVKYMMQDGSFMLGYGYNAFLQGQIRFIHTSWGNDYVVAPVMDVGLVSIFTESGLVGMLAYLGLLGYMLVQSIRKRTRTGAFDFYKLMIFAVPMYLLLNFLSAFVNVALAWLVFGLFHAYERLDQKGIVAEASALPEKKWQF